MDVKVKHISSFLASLYIHADGGFGMFVLTTLRSLVTAMFLADKARFTCDGVSGKTLLVDPY